MKFNENKKFNLQEQTFFIVPSEAIITLLDRQERILQLLNEVIGNTAKDAIGAYISEAEAKKLLGKKTTWFWKMRNTGQLPYAKAGNKVFYVKEDIVKLLNNNYIPIV